MHWAILQIPSMGHRKKLRWLSVRLNGVSVRVRTQYAESLVFKIYSPIDKIIQFNGLRH